MKVFSRLNLTVKAAVKDIPADLKQVIQLHYNGGMKEFLKDTYRYTLKDLNDLEMAPDTFTKTNRLKESDITGITGERDKILIINVFENEKDRGIFAIEGAYPRWFENGRQQNVFELSKTEDPSKPWRVDYRNVGISGKPRNVPVVLNWPGITYKAWIIDLSKAKDTKDLRNERYEAQRGILQRFERNWGVDKSGYTVDRNKYKDMLKELKRAGNDYVDRIAKISAEFFDVTMKLQKKDPNASSWDIRAASDAMHDALEASVNKYGYDDNKKINAKIDEFQRRVDNLKKKL